MSDEIQTILAQPTMTVAELARVLRVGAAAGYSMVNSKQVESRRVGRQIRIPTVAVRRLLGLDHEGMPA
jgi:excisionase family DNA binding protein